VTRVKICGLMDTKAATAAAQAGADFLGILFAPSRRQLPPEKGKELADAIHRLKQPPLLVGVFVNTPETELNATAALCQLDFVQLSGDESWRYCRRIEYPIIKVIHISRETQSAQVLSEIETGLATPLKHPPLFLLDSKGGSYGGGSGKTFNWQLAAEVAAQHPVIVAGGLNPANITELVNKARPWGVDVSSGVESEGAKDTAKIREFIEAVRQAGSRDTA